MRTLKRIPQKAMIAGVIAGFADYFAIDVTVLRVLFVAALLVTGFFPLGLAYIIAIFIMPIQEPIIHAYSEEKKAGSQTS
jgi:phage shock protein C